MSGGGGGRGGSRAAIPAGTKSMVQSLKEIVNCTEQEIYAALKDCNMDPNEAVNRLISQDTFHEVKSKREKKKETKEIPESRSQKVSSSSSRGVRGGTDRSGRNNTIQVTSNDNGVTRGKPVQKKENGENTFPTSSVLGSGMMANNSSRRSTPLSSSDFMGNAVQSTGLPDSISLSSQPSSTFQQNWPGMRGHLSMADIVKMGRPQGKPSGTPVATTAVSQSYGSHNVVMSNTLHDSAKHCQTTVSPPQTNQEFHSSQGIVSKVMSSHEPSITVSQHLSVGEWSLIDESPPESDHIVSETSGVSIYPDPPASSTLHVDGDDLQPSPHLDDIRVLEEDVNDESLPADSIISASISDRQIQMDNYGGNSCLEDDGSLKNMSSYQSPINAYEHHKVEDINVELSSVAANMQQISLHKEQSLKSVAGNPAVIIPDHLQVTNADCLHLSFGSFESGISASFSGAFTSNPLKNNLEVPSVGDNSSSIDHSETRESEYYDNEQLQSTSNENVAPTTSMSTGNYDVVSDSQPDVIRDDTLDATHRLQHNGPSVSGYAFSSTAQANAAGYVYAESNSQLQNLAPFSSATQPYTNSLPSNMLASTAHPFREYDLPLLPLFSTQSVPAKYSTAMSSISGPTISMQEAVKPGVFSIPQLTPQTMPGTSVSTSPALPQHLPVHPYSQPTLPLGHFANMIGYPFLPQSFAIMPSAFQQAYSGSTAFHQSPAALNSTAFKYTLPQFKSSISVNSLPPSAAVASGYGSSANIPGSFTQNSTTVSASTSVGYEEALGSQYKEGHHFVPLHQNENSPMWVHGAGSRTMPAVPGGTYYGFQGQNQQSGIRQGQHPSQFGALGYPNLYHSQAGIQEHQQHPSEGNLNGSQGPASQQSHHIWQHSY